MWLPTGLENLMLANFQPCVFDVVDRWIACNMSESFDHRDDELMTSPVGKADQKES